MRRPILLPAVSLNQMLPSAPTVIPLGRDFAVGTVNFLIVRGATSGMRAMALPPVPAWSVAHMKLSAPEVMPVGLPAMPIWLTVPAVVTTATLLIPGSVTHRLPSGPETIREGAALAGRANWVT